MPLYWTIDTLLSWFNAVNYGISYWCVNKMIRSKQRQTWAAKFHPQHLIFLSVQHWHQGTDGGISKPCEKCQQSSGSSIFFPPVMVVAGEKSTPQKSPSSASDSETGEITLYQLSHKVTVKVWLESARISSGVMLETQNTSDASSQPPARTELQL